jgi:tetratricopeptide (TPR) repeat protein
MMIDGRAWIPIETTQVGSFTEAWQRAAATVREAAAPEVIMVRDAWVRHPPVAWRKRATTLQIHAEPDRVASQLAAIDGAQKAEWTAAVTAVDQLPPSAAISNRKGLLMMAAGRIDEAEAAFTAAAKQPDAGIEAINNLANVHLLRGRFEPALRGYEMVLERTPDQIRVRLNAAIAARMAGDDARFAEEITDCLEAKGGRELVQRFLTALEGFETARGGSASRVRLRALAEAVHRVAQQRGVVLRLPDARASEDRLLRMEQVLFWL